MKSAGKDPAHDQKKRQLNFNWRLDDCRDAGEA